MTREEFRNLSPLEQETFLNEGGEISTQPGADISPVPGSEVLSGSSELAAVEGELVENVGPAIDMKAVDPVQPAPQPSLRGGAELDVVPALGSINNEPTVDRPTIQSSSPLVDARDSIIDTSEQPTKPDGFDIANPVELLFLLDDDIANGNVKLHDWQAQFMIDFAMEDHTKSSPFYAAVRAANGSGKDKYIVAACVVWICMRYSLARGVVTNGSGTQLDNQTETYIRYLCQRANIKWAGGKELIWKCNYRYYECIPTKSPIVLFATDEPTKAEGYHPLRAGGRMAIFTSESKAIPDTIFTALTRCTGFTHRVDVSSPGLPVGYFYDKCMGAWKRKELKSIVGLSPGSCIEYHITAFDCAHITKAEIDGFAADLPLGVNDPVYISGILAEFTSTSEQVVIPSGFVNHAFKVAPGKLQHVTEVHNKGGLDLSDGNAETVLVVRNGNKMIGMEAFRFENTWDTILYLETLFDKYKLTDKDAIVNVDVCGIGKPMADSLKARGWSNIRYVDSRHRAAQPKVYFNRATELFFNVRKLMQNKEIIGEYDKQLITQLCTRFYKLRDGVIRQLLTKAEMRAKGFVSPDRADAFNLCFWDYKSTTVFKNFSEQAPDDPLEDRPIVKPIGDFSLKVWANGKTESLTSFQRNVSNKQPIKHLQRELDRYISHLNKN